MKNKVTVKRTQLVTPIERHYEVSINGKTLAFAFWQDEDFYFDYEILTDQHLLDEEELDSVVSFINELDKV